MACTVIGLRCYPRYPVLLIPTLVGEPEPSAGQSDVLD